ncbi:MAG TPA: LysM domain protein, partial [Xanthomonadaceae bacterium]|nr:LysM domain protein [Xanthomonadaceae bacterium]
MLQAGDEVLQFRGLSVSATRTYNSQGLLADTGGDGWLTGFERRVLLTGDANAASSVARLQQGDGSYTDFRYDATNHRYLSAAGSGAHDVLVWDAASSTWTLTEGSTRRQEVYASHGDPVAAGRLIRIVAGFGGAEAPAHFDVLYDGQGRVSAVSSDGGNPQADALLFSYDGNGRPAAISTREAGRERTQVAYEYDAIGRLAAVVTDLTPDDATDNAWNTGNPAANDGHLFRTEYRYSGDSARIAGIRQSDGIVVQYAYQLDGRIASVTYGEGTDAATYTLTYNAGRTDIADSDGRTWSYLFDTAGQLIEVLAPAMAGLRGSTRYTYDADGNVLSVVQARGAQLLSKIDYAYDAAGNVVRESDATGAVLVRSYSANNQVLAETRYPNGSAAVDSEPPPAGALRTRYVYDAQDRLRFTVDAEGRVTELTYADGGTGVGQRATLRQFVGAAYAGTVFSEAALAAFSADNLAESSLTTYGYDAAGRLNRTTAYASVDVEGAGIFDAATAVTTLVYDAQGLLRRQATVPGAGSSADDQVLRNVVDYAYDGLGRLLSVVRYVRDGLGAQQVAQTQTYSYLDASRRIEIATGGAATQVSLQDSAGRTLTSWLQAPGEAATARVQHYYYDASGQLRASEDALGGRSYSFYDEKGRLAAVVGPSGEVTGYSYDGADRLLATTRYANRVTTAGWVVDGEVVPTSFADIGLVADAANDRVVRAAYDAAGRLATETDEVGAVTSYAYDALGRLVKNTVGSGAAARVTRSFYDRSGKVLAILDAEGYLTEMAYDAAGRKIRQVVHATATNAAARAAGSLAELRPADAAGDQATRWFYDGRGNLVGELDAEGYVTEYVFDQAGNSRATLRYYQAATGATSQAGWTQIRAQVANRADGAAYRQERRQYNDLGQLELSVAENGLTTRYQYDVAGRLVRTEAGGDWTIRQNNVVYNAFGEIVAELDGVGSQALEHADDPQSVWDQYALRHEYDALGRRIRTTRPDGSATWFFYDAGGNLTFAAVGVSNEQNVKNARIEVTEYRYNAFGQAGEQLGYAGRLELAVPGSRESVANALATLAYVSGTDTRTQWTYGRDGRVASQFDALGVQTRTSYNVFGEVVKVEQAVGTSRATTTTFEYDRLGQLTRTVENAGANRLNLARSSRYDAFGRVVVSTDARGGELRYSYDRLGRMVATAQMVDGRDEATSTTYDAFDRALRVVDARGNATTYAYSESGLRVTTTTAEGVVTDSNYDEFGNLRSVSGSEWSQANFDANGQLVHFSEYDKAYRDFVYDTQGRLSSQTVDGVTTRYEYDDAGRLTATIQNPGSGGDLVTRYTYDALGRQLSVTDAAGVQTRYGYDAVGRLLESVLDPGGLAIRTTYTWDELGRQLSVTRAAGTTVAQTTTYAYDGVGRRIRETAASGKLNLSTTYSYDGNGNVTSRTDAAGRITRYTYDAADRLRFEVDGAGGVTEHRYDANGLEVAVRRFAVPIAVDLGLQVGSDQVAQRLVRNDARDQQQYTVRDADGRVAAVIDGAGGTTLYRYNQYGYLTKTTQLANGTVLDSSMRVALQSGEAEGLLAPVTDDARDIAQWNVYSTYGQLRGTVDSAGRVTAIVYDSHYRVAERREYSDGVKLDEASWVTDNQIPRELLDAGTLRDVTALVSDRWEDRQVGYVRDAAGRVVFELTTASRIGVSSWSDGSVAVKEYRYSETGEVVQEVLYGVLIASQYWAALGYTSVDAVRNALSTAFEQRQVDVGYGTVDADMPTERITTYVYDAAGRQRFAVDGVGAVTESIYDAGGQLTEQRTYDALVPVGSNDAAQIRQALASATYRKVTYRYDAAGRVSAKGDGLDRFEWFGYDGSGLVVKHQDRTGAVWNYEYDAAGRKTAQLSPAITVTELDPYGGAIEVERRVVTRYRYDAQGNLTALVEDADGGHSRVTEYEYDNRGHQVRIIFPDAGVLDGSELVASGRRPTVEVSYNTLGQAVMQKDVRGFYSYKTYDAGGRVEFEIDAAGGVTSYGYNAFGEQQRMTRHADAFAATAGQALGDADVQALRALHSSQDRHLYTAYDRAGRKSDVLTYPFKAEYLSPGYGESTRINYGYDAFGNMVREAVLIDSQGWNSYSGLGYGEYAFTYHYYDAAGQEIARLDAESYLTRYEYTANGQLARQTEYANPVYMNDYYRESHMPPQPPEGTAASGFDRVTSYVYDAAGRKVKESTLRHVQDASGNVGVATLDSTYVYDAEGRVTNSKVKDQSLTMSYDALGRLTGTREASRTALHDGVDGMLSGGDFGGIYDQGLYLTVTPTTTYRYDAFGNIVLQTSGIEDEVLSWQSFRYDWQGRNIQQSDPFNTVTRSFDAADHVLEESRQVWYGSFQETTSPRFNFTWQPVESLGYEAEFSTRYTYDAVGRQLSKLSVREGFVDGASLGVVVEAGERVAYNAFGEVVGKDVAWSGGDGGEAYRIQYEYDSNGNVVWSNEGGVQRWYTYDAVNRQLSESHYATGSEEIPRVETWFIRDKLGRIQARVRNSSYALGVPDAVSTQYGYDRWGNQTYVRDELGNVTELEYNENNQLVRQVGAEVKVVSASGVTTYERPQTRWFYDAFGQLVGTRDANGNGRRYEYDPRGRLVREVDAAGGAKMYRYDTAGNQALTYGADGKFTLRKFDQAGRVVSVWGELNRDGYREWFELERYVLDQDGNRLVSLDAEGKLLKAWYDGQGRMLRSETNEGVVAEYEYDLHGNRIRERNALSGTSSGGTGEGRQWYVDRDGQQVWFNEKTWEYDAFNRVVDHNDLSGLDYNYTYDELSGQLVTVSVSRSPLAQFAAAQVALDPEPGEPDPAPPTLDYANGVRRYYYDIDGRIARIEEDGTDASGVDCTIWTRYEYDAGGNRVLEETRTYDANGQILQVRTQTSYDALNRIERVVQDDLVQQRRLLDVRYSYDAVGNRRLVEMGSQFNPAGNQPANAGFEEGNRDWTLGEGWSIRMEEGGGDANNGLWSAEFKGSWNGPQSIVNNKRIAVVPGQSVTASAMVQQGASSAGKASARVMIVWYDANGNMLPGGEGISWSGGNVINSGSNGQWKKSSVSVVVPEGAAYMAIGASANKKPGHPLWVDDFQWTYSPGATPANPPVNGGFEEGDSGWTKGEGWIINQQSTGGDAFTGDWSAQFNGSTDGPQSITNDVKAPVVPGQIISASAMVQQGGSSAGRASARVLIIWYDADGNMLPGGEGRSWSAGNTVSSGSNGAWHKSSVTATVPEGAAFMSIGASALKNPGTPLWVDDFQWSYIDPGMSDDQLPIDTSYWFEYDAENRVVVSNGVLSNGKIVIANDGVSSLQSYDAAGNAVYRKFYESGVIKQQQLKYDEEGRVVQILQAVGNGSWHVLETSRYDGSGQLIERQQFADDGSAKHVDVYEYDRDGRPTLQQAYGIPQGGSATPGGGLYGGLTLLSEVSYSLDGQSAYDEAGRLRGYTYTVHKNEQGSGITTPAGYTHTYRYAYQAAETYLTKQVTGTSTNSNYKTSNSYSSYDDWGRLVAVREQTPGGKVDDRVRYFAMDLEGNILRRTEGTIESGLFTQDDAARLRTEQYVYSNGQYIASGRYDGKTDVLGMMAAYDDSGVGTYQVTIQAGDTLRG